MSNKNLHSTPAVKKLVCFKKGRPPRDSVQGARAVLLDMHTLRSDGLGSCEQVAIQCGVFCPEGGLLLACDGSGSGTPFLAPFGGIVGSTLALLKVNKKRAHTRFLYYWLLRRHASSKGALIGAAIPHLDVATLLTDRLWCPPLEEQTRIAAFLDTETALIDKQVKLTEELIERLKELKRVVVDRAVRGVGAEPLQETGIVWVGSIPENWKLSRAKSLFTEVCEKGYGNLPLLAATQHAGVIFKDDMERRTVEVSEANKHTLKRVRPDNFVISLRSFEGGIEHSKVEGTISSAYTVLCLKKGQVAGYWRYLFKSSMFISGLQQHQNGIREGQSISYSTFRQDRLPEPPIAEQKAIADYLDKELSRIDRLVELYQRKIALLAEQRQVLIQDYVLGTRRLS